jgi:tetratricopeptide (TPR) repeat protein
MSMLLLGFPLALVVAGSPNEDPLAKAKTHFAEGDRLAKAHRYDEAIPHFQEGYELSRRPVFLFNMGECARLAGDPARARASYQRYLEEDPHGPLAATAKTRLAGLEASIEPTRSPVSRPDLTVPVPPLVEAAPAFSPAPSGAHTVGSAQIDRTTHRPLWRRWPFWTAIGVAVAGATVAILATNGGDGGCGMGCMELDLRGRR